MQTLDANGLPQEYPFNAEWEVTPRDVRRRMQAGETLVLIDCRTSSERDIARIEGAIHTPMHDLASHISALRKHEGDPIVVHCHHGARSLQVTAALREAGFENVRSMAGGIHLWSLDIDPQVPVY